MSISIVGEYAAVPLNGFTLRSPAASPSGTPASLLLKFDGDFSDSSPNGLTVTPYGGAVISTAQSRFGGASGYFDAAGSSYLRASLPFDWTGDFTIEMWIYRTGNGTGQVHTLFEAGDIQSGIGGINIYYEPSGALSWNNGIAADIVAGSLPSDQWVHLAAVRSNGTSTLYVDGVAVASSSAQSYPVSNSVISIGGAPNYGFFANAYIDDLRIVKGLAVYTGPFIPPAAPLSAFATPAPIAVPASLLLRFDGNFDDSSSNGLTATAYGNADTSADESKFGGSSLVLDGSSYLTVSGANAFAFGTGDFTAECWVRVDRAAAINQYVFDFGSNNGQVQILNGFGGYDGLVAIDFAATTIYGYGPFESNTWTHIAVSRKAGVVRFFIDGIMHGSMTDNGAYAGSTLTIGNYGGGGYQLYGYIDDLRIVKGLAVYTNPFNPPSAPLSAYATIVS